MVILIRIYILIILLKFLNCKKNITKNSDSSGFDVKNILCTLIFNCCKNLELSSKIIGYERNSPFSEIEFKSFLGVRYGEPPIGPKRFRPVERVDLSKSSNTVFIKMPNPCVHTYNNEIFGVEDCLFLNIFVPEGCKDNSPLDRCPVLAFAHGGFFTFGRLDILGPDFIMERNSVIFVTIAYRLGPFGWMSFDNYEAPGNVGAYDVRLALEWIQNNIGHFGGDCSRVTLWGQGSGAAIAMQLLQSPVSLEKPQLFHRIIADSGAAFAPWSLITNKEKYIQDALLLARDLRCKESDLIDIARCLKNKSAIELQEKFTIRSQEQFNTNFDFNYLASPVLSRKICSLTIYSINCAHPDMNLKEGNYNKNIPVLLGVNEHDGSFLLAKFYKYICSIDLENCLDMKNTIQFLKLYKDLFLKVIGSNDMAYDIECINDAEKGELQFIKLATKIYFSLPAYSFAVGHSENWGSVFLYKFNYTHSKGLSLYTLVGGDRPIFGGVAHGNELIYAIKFEFFGSNFYDANDIHMIETMTGGVTNFAYYDNPTPLFGFWKKFHSEHFFCFLFPCDESYLEINLQLRNQKYYADNLKCE